MWFRSYVKVGRCVSIAFLCLCIFNVFFGNFAAHASAVFLQKEYSVPQNKSIFLGPDSKVVKNLKWTSENKNIATVDGRGIVRAVACGETVIKVINTKNKKTSECKIKVTPAESVRAVYTSANMAGVDASFDVFAVTPKNVSEVRFEIKTHGYENSFVCKEKSGEENLYLWKKSVSLPKEGTYKITISAKIQNKYHKCAEECTEILVSKEFDKKKLTLAEKRVSPEGLDFIASCEGFHPAAYTDTAGILTIGYGKRIWPGESFYNNLSKAEVNALFAKSVNQGSFTRMINKFLINNHIKFNQRQFDALLSFSYNLGGGWLRNGSDLSKIILNSGGKGKKLFGTVKSDNGLYVRSAPSTSSKKLCAISNNAHVDILNSKKENDKWYHIKTSDGITGYCYSDYLKAESVSAGEKSLDTIDKTAFIKEFSLYHHAAGHKCCKGLLSRRFHELDIFFYGVYSRFRSKHFSYGKYPIPECAKKIM